MSVWTRADYEADRARYEAERQRLLDSGLTTEHPLVKLQARRIETVDLKLSDPAYGLAEES
jgi:hypothetical protein